MRVVYHRLVENDVAEVLEHYGALSPTLAEDFRRELKRVIAQAAANPFRFHPAGRYRRANLTRFPYHILYEVCEDTLRIMVLRHNKRHPRYGVGRR
jgi:plasmid stabilization system protein ParE